MSDKVKSLRKAAEKLASRSDALLAIVEELRALSAKAEKADAAARGKRDKKVRDTSSSEPPRPAAAGMRACGGV